MSIKIGDTVITKHHKGMVKALRGRSGVVTLIKPKEPFPVFVRFTQAVQIRAVERAYLF